MMTGKDSDALLAGAFEVFGREVGAAGEDHGADFLIECHAVDFRAVAHHDHEAVRRILVQTGFDGVLAGGTNCEDEIQFKVEINAAVDMAFEGPGHIGDGGAHGPGLHLVFDIMEQEFQQILNAGESGDVALRIHDRDGADPGAFHALIDVEKSLVLAGFDDVGAADGFGGGPQIHDEVGRGQAGAFQDPAGAGIERSAAGGEGIRIAGETEQFGAANSGTNGVGIRVLVSDHIDGELARAGFFKRGLNHAKWKL